MVLSFTISAMAGIIAGRTASEMPGLDIAEQRSWQNFLDSALRLYATLNHSLVEEHQLTLNDVRLLDLLDRSATGSSRMGDLADELMSLPSRVTRQIRRLETQGLVRRGASPDDGRGVLATITDEGRSAVHNAMVTYGQGVRDHFLGRLSRPQIAAIGENCRRISTGLKGAPRQARPSLEVASRAERAATAKNRGNFAVSARSAKSALRVPLLLSAVAWQSGLMHSP